MDRFVILGSSNAVAKPGQDNTHLFVQSGSKKILVDCGNNPMAKLGSIDISVTEITDLVLTHFHADHIGSLPLLIMDMWLEKRTAPLTIYGLDITIDKAQKLLDLFDWQKWMNYAAVFIGAVILSTAFHYFYLADKFSSGSEVFASVSSPRGQITSLTLFDGTTVWLNSGSTLKYSNQFGKGKREVSLEGEALFEVQKDLGHSFIVNMDGSKIKVHGTIFNAKNYHAEKEVVLLEGKIEYANQGKNVFLKPNERITEDKNTGATTIDQVDASIYSSWIGGKIYFDNESLQDLSLRLERWYDMEFVFEKENIKSYKFTGVINKDKSLDYSLRIIQLTNKVKFRKERDKIIITE